MAIQLMSNVKIVTSGNAPTTENLLVGQAAFGKLTKDGLYHLWGNSDGTIVDLVMSTASGIDAFDLQQVLTQGNETTLDIQINGESGAVTLISKTGVTATNGTRQLAMIPATGFTDAGQPVLSANPENTIDSSQAKTMRDFLEVYSKAEVNTKITGVYRYKGTVESYTALTTKEDYTPAVGDVWNIETAGGVDKNGTAIKAGDNVAFVGPEKSTDWDVLSGIVDLTNYYTKTEVNNIKTTLEGAISAADTKAQNAASAASAADGKATAAQTDATQALEDAAAASSAASTAKTAADTAQKDVDALEKKVTAIEGAGYQTADDVQGILTDGHYVSDEHYVHTDNNYSTADKTKVDKLVTNGEGNKVLTDDGTYQQLELSVVSI